MDEKDRQLYEATLVVESAKQTAELGKEVAGDIVRPTSKSIGKNIGLLIDGAFGWLGVWGEKQKIKQQLNLDEFKKIVSENIEAIPQDNLKEPTMYIVGPAIEASKYYYEEDYFKEMFAKLIAASCDSRCNDKISPYFVEAIKQISHNEAAILSLFKNSSILPVANYVLDAKNGGSVYLYKNVFYLDNPSSNSKPNDFSSAIVNLERLGFIEIDFRRAMKDNEEYSIFETDPVYLQTKQGILENTITNSEIYKSIKIGKGILEITPLGKDFIDLCL